MLSIILGHALGLSPVVAASLGLAEGACLTVIIAKLAERYLFPMPQD